MSKSIFDDKSSKPTELELQQVLGKQNKEWQGFINYIQENYGNIIQEWKFYSKSAGWCLRVSENKGRNIVFLLPNKDYFIVTINFGTKIVNDILKSRVTDINKQKVMDAKVYMEGISILIEVRNNKDLDDIKMILSIRDK